MFVILTGLMLVTKLAGAPSGRTIFLGLTIDPHDGAGDGAAMM